MDDKLRAALKSLPRERAGAGFTAGVLCRLEEPHRGPARRGSARWPLLAAAAVLVLAVVLGGREWWHYHQRQQVTARLLTMERERQALVGELGDLRRQMAGARPVIYLGGSNDLDLVLDLVQAKRDGVRPEDLRQGLLRAYRLGQPPQTSAPAYGVPDRGPASAGAVPARLDEGRTRTIY